MQSHTVDGGGPSEAAGQQPGSAPAHGPELAQRVLLHWRVRCLVRRAPLRATSGSDALALCAALLWTLDHRAPAPGLALAARRWAEAAAGVPDSAQALECLDEVVVEIAEVAFPGFPPHALRRVLDLVRDEAAAVPARRAAPPAVDSTTGLPDRRALELDLDALVAAAIVGTGLDLAVAVVEPEYGAKGSLHRGRRPAGGAGVAALVAALRGGIGHVVPGGRLYHLGMRRLAVLLPRGGTAAVGEIMLRATCADAPPFVWGSSSLRVAGARAVAQPDALVVLAEADLHLRRRDLVRARAALARQHRQRRLMGSVAAGLVLLVGVGLGLVGSGGSGRPGVSALHAPPTTITAPIVASPPAPAPSRQPSQPASVPASNIPAPSSTAPAPEVHLVEAVIPGSSGAPSIGQSPPPPPPPGNGGAPPPSPSPPAHPSPPHPSPPHPVPPSSPPGQSPGPVGHVVGAVLGTVSGLAASVGA